MHRFLPLDMEMEALFETPPPEPTRRTTRRVLTEIPGSAVDNQVTVTGRVTAAPQPVTRTPINSMLSYVTPSPSPDEIVIQARGRRRLPDTWSPPDFRYSPSYRNRSPVKDSTPNKFGSAIVTRSTPRKRLLMGDTPPDVPSSPECKSLSPMLKKMRLEPASPLHGGGPGEPFAGLKLKALSRAQLIEVIESLAKKHPPVEDELKHNLPLPDLRPITDKLYDLRRNIFKSLPTSRLSSKSDGSAYSRASTHVHAFKKAVLEAGKNYVASQEWDTVFRYAVMAWSQTTSTPVWDNCPHNAPRRQCYRYLAGIMQQALKKMGKLPDEEIENLQTKFKKFSSESEDILPCLKILQEMKSQAQ